MVRNFRRLKKFTFKFPDDIIKTNSSKVVCYCVFLGSKNRRRTTEDKKLLDL